VCLSLRGDTWQIDKEQACDGLAVITSLSSGLERGGVLNSIIVDVVDRSSVSNRRHQRYRSLNLYVVKVWPRPVWPTLPFITTAGTTASPLSFPPLLPSTVDQPSVRRPRSRQSMATLDQRPFSKNYRRATIPKLNPASFNYLPAAALSTNPPLLAAWP